MLKNKQGTAKHITSVQEIENCDCYFLDMYGLLWDGNQFYDGTLDFLKKLKSSGKKIVLLSNATVLKKPFIESQKKKGLEEGVHFDEVITSGETFYHVVNCGFFEKATGKKDYRFFVVGTQNIPLFENVAQHQTDDLTKADIVYLSGLGAVTPEEGEAVFKEQALLLNEALKRGLPAVCANPDLTFMSKGKQVMTQGSTGRYYETMGGKVHWFGKPYPYIFEFALEKTGVQKEKTVMVGDTVETDVLGASKAGIRTLLATKTGITGDFIKQGVTLESLYQKHGVQPTYTMDQFSHLMLNFKVRRNHVSIASITSKKSLCL